MVVSMSVDLCEKRGEMRIENLEVSLRLRSAQGSARRLVTEPCW